MTNQEYVTRMIFQRVISVAIISSVIMMTTLYINQYYEKTGSEVTTHYYLGSKEIAQRKGASPNFTLTYLHQDSLGSSSVVSSTGGASEGSIRYYPYGVSFLFREKSRRQTLIRQRATRQLPDEYGGGV